jgi:hypothetical protein
MGDMAGLVDTIKKAVPLDGQPELYKRLSEGIFTLRDMYEQFSNILKVTPHALPQYHNLLLLGLFTDVWARQWCRWDR